MDSDSHLNNYPLLPVAMVLMTGIVAGDAACAHMGMDRCGAQALARVDQWLKAGWAVVMLGILVALFFHKRHVKGIGVFALPHRVSYGRFAADRPQSAIGLPFLSNP